MTHGPGSGPDDRPGAEPPGEGGSPESPWHPAPGRPGYPAPPPWSAPGPEGHPQDPYGGANPTQPLPYHPPPPYDPPPGAGYGPPPGQLPPSGYGPPPPGGGRGGSRMPLVIALIVIGVVVLGALTAGGIAYVSANDDPSPPPTPTQSTSIWSPTPQPSPTETTSAPPTKDPSRLDKRSTDSKPLSVSEMFPKKYRGTSGYTYTRYKTFSTTHCSSAAYVHGGKLIKALSSGKCNQLLVASYVDHKHNVQTNAGIANVVDAGHAKHASGVASAKGPFFRTLPAPAAWHTAYAFDEAHGHYVLYEIVAAAKGSTNPRKFGAKAFLGFADMQGLLERPLDRR